MLRKRSTATVLTIAALGAIGAFAWVSLPAPSREQSGHGHAAGAAPAQGIVVAIDRPGRLVTISHGPLYNLGMPAMTMGFRVDDAAVLGTLDVGDRVRFEAGARDGAFIASKLERVPAGNTQ
jgi:Cu/Ag efflux protein CusF